jgi:hypothetical protein
MTTRRKPDPTRKGVTRKIRVARIELYVTLNTYEDGEPCELFIKANGQAGEDGDVQGWCNVLAITASLGFQRGLTLADLCRHWRGQSFDPSQLGKASSIPDAVARALTPEDAKP